MAKQKGKADGETLFGAYYQNIYQDRWEPLKAALIKDKVPIAYNEGLTQPYYLDEASVLAAKLLGVQKGETVLDMCAAPGGKTLVLASCLQGEGKLVSNDRSSSRRARLKQVVKDHLSEAERAIVQVTAHDATRWSLYEQNVYDRVLLDAPCSSERHVLHDPKALAMWSPSRPKRLAITQFAMLAAALEAVKVGGYILYCTCSINPMENERVVEKLFEKRVGRFTIMDSAQAGSEEKDYGSIILPDQGEGRGPLYFCLIRRDV
ncbi:MAG: RsmB/NOP family class I SAM-dependent RNA methyltransferase [Sphaerochaetaceae bacterium]|nr:RsmB/NOP family class I SAM-dependent RNA methyltransferase [Sphaerochaetaceae bacterium]